MCHLPLVCGLCVRFRTFDFVVCAYGTIAVYVRSYKMSEKCLRDGHSNIEWKVGPLYWWTFVFELIFHMYYDLTYEPKHFLVITFCFNRDSCILWHKTLQHCWDERTAKRSNATHSLSIFRKIAKLQSIETAYTHTDTTHIICMPANWNRFLREFRVLQVLGARLSHINQPFAKRRRRRRQPVC